MVSPIQISSALGRVQSELKNKRVDICAAAIKNLEGLYKLRIFVDGKATNGTAIGKYRSNWKNVRRKAGRQVRFVDLDFSSDLRLSIQTGQSGNTCLLGFINDLARLKAEGNTEQRKKPIFEISQSEEKEAADAFDAEVDRILRKII